MIPFQDPVTPLVVVPRGLPPVRLALGTRGVVDVVERTLVRPAEVESDRHVRNGEPTIATLALHLASVALPLAVLSSSLPAPAATTSCSCTSWLLARMRFWLRRRVRATLPAAVAFAVSSFIDGCVLLLLPLLLRRVVVEVEFEVAVVVHQHVVQRHRSHTSRSPALATKADGRAGQHHEPRDSCGLRWLLGWNKGSGGQARKGMQPTSKPSAWVTLTATLPSQETRHDATHSRLK